MFDVVITSLLIYKIIKQTVIETYIDLPFMIEALRERKASSVEIFFLFQSWLKGGRPINITDQR